ncbi:MAG: hypothetical protein DWQ07_14775 [Chloroflexi bacterium]|nr:MAG: hypothetical protein DWQ07_14775 [Chloroflexota bacterium]MBL1195653.1 hypothetical protein [Chloroflexota bacterium]NOH12941.1 hypothetical protein [Chloroflexota bacterium]
MADIPEPTLITSSDHLKQVSKQLAQASLLSVDTESNSLHAFRERVCLIQFSIPDADYLLDPLAVDDLSPLGPIFADPNVEKLFHAAEYDLLTLKRDFDFSFANLFDTMVAARILGRRRVGLGNLLDAEFGIKLEKKFQRADWGKRPLSKDMLSYARFDTHYLIRLRNKLKDELMAKDRWSIAAEDFQRATDVGHHRAEPPHSDVWRMKGADDFSPRQYAVLQALVDFRRERAERVDRPLFKVFGDKTLVAIADVMPTRLEQLYGLDGMSGRQIERQGRKLLAAVERGKKAQPPVRPPRRPRDEQKEERYETLREWRKIEAQKIDVESDVILPRDVMLQLVDANPSSLTEVEAEMHSVPWRFAQFGEDIFEVLVSV